MAAYMGLKAHIAITAQHRLTGHRLDVLDNSLI